jgi:Tfp pilus assembly protein PilF
MNRSRRKKSAVKIDNKPTLDPASLQAGTADEYLKRGLIYHARGDQSKAETDIRKALSLDPDSVDAHYNLGLILRDMRKTGEASAAFRSALAGIKQMEEKDPARALMLSKLAAWQLDHLAKAG